MSNSFISVKQIARETLPRLMENLVFPNLIYRDTAASSCAKKGDTVSVRRPVKLRAQNFSADTGISPQNITEDAVNIKLDRIATVDTEISAIESALSFDSITRLFIEPAAAALAEKINHDGLELYRDIPYTAGTAGTTPSSLADFANAAFELDCRNVPTSGRCAVWSPAASASFKQHPALVNAEKCGSTAALRSGSVGEVFGISNYMTQAVRNHTAGNMSASSPITIKEAVTDSDSITLKGTGLAGNLVKGDILTIDGENYVVKEDTLATGSVKIYPNITCEADKTVTLVPSHEANLVFHPNAFAFVTRPLATPAGVESYVTSYNGISLRVVRGYDMKYKREMLSMDVLYAFAPLYPELACRYLG